MKLITHGLDHGHDVARQSAYASQGGEKLLSWAVSTAVAGKPGRRVGHCRLSGGRYSESSRRYGRYFMRCDLGQDEDAAELLGFAAGREWMADLARRAQSVAQLDDTVPSEPEHEELQITLWRLYAASRIRDALLLAHQPGPADDSVRELDAWLCRKQPCFQPVPIDQITHFFTAIGCRPVTETSFDRSCMRSSPARPPPNPIPRSR